MLGFELRNCWSLVSNSSILGVIFLIVVPSLLLIPVLYYSLTTPFALVDDYGLWKDMAVFDGPISRWANWHFLNFSAVRTRYRPLWEIYNATTWSLFGATPWMHHLSRWIWHFGAVLTFIAAFRCFSRNHWQEDPTASAEREKIAHLLPLVFLVYVWVFFPNCPYSRLGPQEVYTVFFLGLCTWMTALILSKKNEEGRTSSSFPQYVIFHMSYAGLCISKEVGIAGALWMLIFYCAFLVSGNAWKKFMSSIPLALIFFHTFGMVYVAAKTSGVGYKEAGYVPQPLEENAIRILIGLSQIQTSPIVTVGFIILFIISVIFVAIKIVNRSLKNESLFVLFLLGLFIGLFSFLSLSFGVVLRYWYILIPIFAMLLAFSVKFILKSVRGCHPIFTYGAVAILAGFVVFFVAVNYYNFLFQTTVEHSLHHAESRLISQMFRLVDQGEYVQIEDAEIEPGFALFVNLPLYSNHFYHQDRQVHKDPPEVGREYFLVSSRKLPIGGDGLVTITPQSSYPLLSRASTVASTLQGAPAFLETDSNVMRHIDQWSIYPMKNGGTNFLIPSSKPLIRSEFDVYFNRNQNMLIYVKEPCQEEDFRAPFFLFVDPVDIEDLPEFRREYRFDNLSFVFNKYGILHRDKCAAARELPDYPIHQISTGQSIDETRLWEGAASLIGNRE